MRILIIGGTRLVGRQIAGAAIDRGHDVTLFNRGKTAPDGLPGATQVLGNRDIDLDVLATGEWDATIDVCAYGHLQVRKLLETLGERAGHYTFISTISVYGQNVPETGFTEDTALLEPEWDDDAGMASYGELKVACEEVAAAYAKDRLLIVRPGYVVGPHDYTERFTHWIRAVAAGRPFAAPATDQPLQCVDGRDLGAFTIGCVERGVIDTFNVTAPQQPPTFAQVLAGIAAALDVELPEVTWSDPDDESEELPLSAAPDWWPKMRADLTKATKAGLTWRPLADTVRDTANFIGLRTVTGL
jgi:2'-hydroxyisoflavone reductase